MGVLVNLRGRRGRESIQDHARSARATAHKEAKAHKANAPQSRSRRQSWVEFFDWLSGMLEVASGGDGWTSCVGGEIGFRLVQEKRPRCRRGEGQYHLADVVVVAATAGRL